jgi:hypothetical protein
MAKGPRPDDIFEFAVAWSAPNYVAKLRASVLRTKSLKRLGHIFDFGTLLIKCSQQHFMRENFTYGSMRGCWRRNQGTD